MQEGQPWLAIFQGSVQNRCTKLNPEVQIFNGTSYKTINLSTPNKTKLSPSQYYPTPLPPCFHDKKKKKKVEVKPSYWSRQDATDHFLNCTPQKTTINTGNSTRHNQKTRKVERRQTPLALVLEEQNKSSVFYPPSPTEGHPNFSQPPV